MKTNKKEKSFLVLNSNFKTKIKNKKKTNSNEKGTLATKIDT